MQHLLHVKKKNPLWHATFDIYLHICNNVLINNRYSTINKLLSTFHVDVVVKNNDWLQIERDSQMSMNKMQTALLNLGVKQLLSDSGFHHQWYDCTLLMNIVVLHFY